MAFLQYHDLQQLKLNTVSPLQFKHYIASRQSSYAAHCLIELPTFICHQDDFYCFERLTSQPNFITLDSVVAEIIKLDNEQTPVIDLAGKIVLIRQADPGYDWLFGHGLAGLITQYGGANSHMAIRAAEMGLPAAIGVGAKLFDLIAVMGMVELDCINQTIRKA